ncbi:MAG: phosphoribosylglycinamide formyltransferase [Deltaproteobacteria bacterium]|nr:phosphoribosylglycinamide formyltransferase [Deltaproteobacteria bacterium]
MTRPVPTIAVLASGKGTNLQAILDAIANGELSATVSLVLSNNHGAPALDRARRAGVPTRVVEQPTVEILLKVLAEAQVELICLAGYLKILPPEVVRTYHNRIMNIHPALLPAFPGLHAVRQALTYGCRVTGVTVHFVDDGVDTGPIILQEAAPISPSDTEASLTKRLHEVEHRLYPEAIRRFIEGKLRVVGRKVLLK